MNHEKFVETWLVVRLCHLLQQAQYIHNLTENPRKPRRKRKDSRRDARVSTPAIVVARDARFWKRRVDARITSKTDATRARGNGSVGGEKKKGKPRKRSRRIPRRIAIGRDRRDERACARARARGAGGKRTATCLCRAKLTLPGGEKKKNAAYPSLRRATTRLWRVWRFASRARDSARRSRSASVSTGRDGRFSTYLCLRRPPQKKSDAPGLNSLTHKHETRIGNHVAMARAAGAWWSNALPPSCGRQAIYRRRERGAGLRGKRSGVTRRHVLLGYFESRRFTSTRCYIDWMLIELRSL